MIQSSTGTDFDLIGINPTTITTLDNILGCHYLRRMRVKVTVYWTPSVKDDDVEDTGFSLPLYKMGALSKHDSIKERLMTVYYHVRWVSFDMGENTVKL